MGLIRVCECIDCTVAPMLAINLSTLPHRGRTPTTIPSFHSPIPNKHPRFNPSHRLCLQSNLLSTLLSAFGGISDSGNLIIVAATNRLSDMDAALLRPGRLDEKVFVGTLSYRSRLAFMEKEPGGVNDRVSAASAASRRSCRGPDTCGTRFCPVLPGTTTR